ncbi:hypothetical protein ACIRVF_34860 [Kitasatospora sp. NPDC101157]|uniref:hypothetical protein n=1 Tax=Kitasatospora sp. NPDC101157 TaxID=3364098 RepID=UPI00381E84C8
MNGREAGVAALEPIRRNPETSVEFGTRFAVPQVAVKAVKAVKSVQAVQAVQAVRAVRAVEDVQRGTGTAMAVSVDPADGRVEEQRKRLERGLDTETTAARGEALR